ncbi:MAG: peptidase U32 family protein [Halobacteriota archaeon]|nr:peptidase U32 family protein [Halobacteriota archaeon]
MKKVELLAPAKNIKSIKAGINYADAFYFGAKKFNMRMQTDNFNEVDLSRGVKICHNNNGKKAYFVSNILVYENELEELERSLEAAKSLEFDAVIVNDLSTVELCREMKIPFHISTQQNISNSKAARFFEELGAQRIILARECSLEQIKEISGRLTKTEIEVFVHGAMCTMVSGRCYLSLDVCNGENSANRGRCVQPCRREWTVTDNVSNEYIYDGVRFLNSRDMCMIEYIPEMIDAKIASFKIEGRMREPHYVDVVTRCYREAIDAHYDGTFSGKKVKRWIFELKKVYNRGFTHGFYLNRVTEEDHQHKSPTNLSHWRLIKMGTITHYSRKNRDGKMARVKLTNGSLKRGQEVIIIGNSRSDTYFHQKIRHIELNSGKVINTTRNATRQKPINVWINVEEPVRPERVDSVCIFTDRTYKNRMDDASKKKRKADYYKL